MSSEVIAWIAVTALVIFIGALVTVLCLIYLGTHKEQHEETRRHVDERVEGVRAQMSVANDTTHHYLRDLLARPKAWIRTTLGGDKE